MCASQKFNDSGGHAHALYDDLVDDPHTVPIASSSLYSTKSCDSSIQYNWVIMIINTI